MCVCVYEDARYIGVCGDISGSDPSESARHTYIYRYIHIDLETESARHTYIYRYIHIDLETLIHMDLTHMYPHIHI